MKSLIRNICGGLVLFGFLASPGFAVDATYTYDALGRLTSVTYPCGGSTSYTYDAAGNRTASAAVAGCLPIAVNDSVTTPYNTAATFDPRTNDSEPNGFALTITAVSVPAHGTAGINSGTSVTYTPTANYYGADSFTYTISNGHGGTATATVSMTVSNGLPAAVADSVSTIYNTAVTYDPRTNDSDPSGFALTVSAVGTPAHGTAVINSGTSITYTPTSGYYGTDSFTYTIRNTINGTATATDTITIVNRAPVAVNDSKTTNENTALLYDPRSNDSDPDGDALTITAASAPGHGTAVVNSGTSITYTPTTSYYGADSFTYTISDGHGNTATATESFTVVNRPPVAANDNISTTVNTPKTFDPRTNDSDPDGDALTITAVSAASHGTTAVNSGVSITYTPTTGYAGADSFTYTISDGHGNTATATVSVNATAQYPVAVNDSVSTNENTAKNYDPRSNDSDPNGSALTIVAVGAASHGTVAIVSGTSVTYTPTTGYSGADSFTYTISNTYGLQATATESFTVVNRAPTAVNDSISTNVSVAKNFDPRANDSDPDGDTLTITAVSAPAHGTAAIVSGTSVTYTPSAGYAGADSFTYTISDGHANTATATVSATVSAVAPVAVADSQSTNENTAKNYDPRTNDSDANGSALTIVAVGAASHGSVTISGGTSVTYTPTASYSGADSFTYTISNSYGLQATATESFTVVSRAPVAVNDSISTNVNAAKNFDPRSNDSDPDGDALTITAASTPAHGTASVISGTSITYTPTTAYGGADSFTYTISDGHGNTATATVSVSVNAQSPVAVADSRSTNENTAINYDPRTNDSDPNGSALTVVATGAAGHGTVSIVSGTSVTYTPTSGYAGSDSFTYTISNVYGLQATATESLTVVSRAPTANNDSISTTVSTAKNFDPRTNDSDPDGDALTITAVSTPSHGTASVVSGTSVTYTPTNAYIGSDSFTYTISDGHGNTATATVSVSVVTPPPQAPDVNIEYTKPPIYNTFDPRYFLYPTEGLLVTSVTAPDYGTAIIQGGGTTIKYTATGGFTGIATFTYTVTDNEGRSATGTVHMTVDSFQ